jgi:hypothetical protein
MRKQNRMRVFGFGVLRRIFGPNRDEITGEWGRLCNKAVRDLCPHEVPEQGRDNRGVEQTV